MCGFSINLNVCASKSPYFLMSININFNKNKPELKIENLTQSFKETNLVLQFI